jgi:hypothetical protein
MNNKNGTNQKPRHGAVVRFFKIEATHTKKITIIKYKKQQQQQPIFRDFMKIVVIFHCDEHDSLHYIYLFIFNSSRTYGTKVNVVVLCVSFQDDFVFKK